MADFTQYAPIIESALLSSMQLIGGLEQQKFDDGLADNAMRIAKMDAADQKRLNRMVASTALANSLQNTGSANLDILAQLAIEGNRRVQRILSNGDVNAAYYRNQGDTAVYEALGNAAFTLGKGFAESYERGLFTKSTPTKTVAVRAPITPVPTPGGTPAALRPSAAI